MTAISKEVDELTGVASYKTDARTLFEVKQGLASSLLSPKSTATISCFFAAVHEQNVLTASISFLEALHRVDPPPTGQLFFLIDGDRFQFECNGQRLHVLGDSVIDIETAQIPLDLLIKFSSCSNAKTRVRGIDIGIDSGLFSDARSLIATLTQDGML